MGPKSFRLWDRLRSLLPGARRGRISAHRQGRGALPAFPVNAVDTTGAGDAFWGALLAQIPGRGRTALEALTLEEWVSATRVANAAGGLTTTAKGAIPAMPDSAAIQACVQAMGRCAFDA